MVWKDVFSFQHELECSTDPTLLSCPWQDSVGHLFDQHSFYCTYVYLIYTSKTKNVTWKSRRSTSSGNVIYHDCCSFSRIHHYCCSFSRSHIFILRLRFILLELAMILVRKCPTEEMFWKMRPASWRGESVEFLESKLGSNIGKVL